MNKVIFVGFDTEQKAYEADRAVRDMHRDGTLTLYNDAVVVKEPQGKVVLRRAPESPGARSELRTKMFRVVRCWS